MHHSQTSDETLVTLTGDAEAYEETYYKNGIGIVKQEKTALNGLRRVC